MPIKIGSKLFQTFNEAVEFIKKDRGFTDKTARAIVGKIENNQATANAAGIIPELEETKDGKFAKFFLINSDWNRMDWRVTQASIPKYLSTFEGMPYISEPELEHFGMDENTPVTDIIANQEKFKIGDIIKTGYDDKKDTGFALVKFATTSEADKVWKDLKLGEAIYVSPAVVGIAEIDQFGRTTYDTWHGLHLARVAKPAYGVMTASMKELCEGPKSTCINNMFTNAIAAMLHKNDSYNVVDPKGAQMQFIDPQTKQPVEANDESIKKSFAFFENQITTLTKTVEDSKKPTPNAAAECPDGEEMIDGECKKKAMASVADPAARKLIEALSSKVASYEKREKDEIVARIASMREQAGFDKNEEALMKLDSMALSDLESSETPLLSKIIELNPNSPGVHRYGNRVVSIPESAGKASAPIISSLDEMEGYL